MNSVPTNAVVVAEGVALLLQPCSDSPSSPLIDPGWDGKVGLGPCEKVTEAEQTGRGIAITWPWPLSMTGQATTTPAQILHPFNGDAMGKSCLMAWFLCLLPRRRNDCENHKGLLQPSNSQAE